MSERVELPSLIAPIDRQWLCALAAAAPPGDFVELGVYKGGSAAALYDVAERQGRRLWLFDTFAGHPAPDPGHDNALHHCKGKYGDAIKPAELQERLPKARIVVGRFPDALALVPGMGFGRRLAFVHSDLDLYAGTEAVCRLLPPLMPIGGMLYFDDYSWGECPGVREAVDNAFGKAPALPNGKRLVVLGDGR